MRSLDFEELCGIAMARLKLTRDQFYDLVPLEYNFALRAVNEKEYEEYKSKYEIARWQITHLWNMQGKILKREIKPEDVVVFPWEKPTLKIQSIDQMKKAFYDIARAFKNKPVSIVTAGTTTPIITAPIAANFF